MTLSQVTAAEIAYRQSQARVKVLEEALTEISEVIDYYKGGFSYQRLYSIRAILGEVGVKPDDAVVSGEKPSPLEIEHRSGKPRRPGKKGRLDDTDRA